MECHYINSRPTFVSGTQSTVARVRLQPVFALIALVAWQYSLDSTLSQLFMLPKYG